MAFLLLLTLLQIWPSGQRETKSRTVGLPSGTYRVEYDVSLDSIGWRPAISGAEIHYRARITVYKIETDKPLRPLTHLQTLDGQYVYHNWCFEDDPVAIVKRVIGDPGITSDDMLRELLFSQIP